MRVSGTTAINLLLPLRPLTLICLSTYNDTIQNVISVQTKQIICTDTSVSPLTDFPKGRPLVFVVVGRRHLALAEEDAHPKFIKQLHRDAAGLPEHDRSVLVAGEEEVSGTGRRFRRGRS